MSEQFGNIPLPIGPAPTEGLNEACSNWPISEKVHGWYKRRYGDRLKNVFVTGKMAFFIRNDVWVFGFPTIFGKVELFAHQTASFPRHTTDGTPAKYNVLDAIEGLPVGLRESLTDCELREVFDNFLLGMHANKGIQTLMGEVFVRNAIDDISAAVEHLRSEHPNCGLSKWSSLQAAEKIIKAAIRKLGGSFTNSHSLVKLTEQAVAAGISDSWSDFIPAIQCQAAVRYGEVLCSLTEAMDAHHASLRFSFQLTKSLSAY